MKSPIPVVCMLAFGCLAGAGNVPGQEALKQTPPAASTSGATTNAVAPAANTTPSSLSGYVPDDKHSLRIGDRFSFQILEDGDPPRSYVVDDSGEIDFPYLGRRVVRDKTCKQMADELKAELEKDYYYHATPILAMEVANRVLGKVYLWGAVRSTGAQDVLVNETLTVGKAIMRAGGFAEFANKKKVKLIRDGQLVAELNIDEILEQGRSDKDPAVKPEDFIVVPTRLINF